MSSIVSVQQIAAAIRVQIVALGSSTARPDKRAKAGARQTKAAPEGALPAQAMGDLIAKRVEALDPDDPGRGRKAFRILLESLLLAELGERLINDPGFYDLVDQVQLAMEGDPQLADAITQAADGLLGHTRPA